MALSEQLKFVLSADVNSAVSGFQKVGRTADTELGKAESRLQKVSGNMTKLGAGAAAFAGVAAAGLFKAAGAFQNLAVSAGKFSDTTGVAIEDASRWIEVAGDMGVEAGSVEGALNRLNRAIATSPEKLDQYGVSVARLRDGTVDVNGTFLNLVDRLNEIPDSSARAAVATDLLGRGWTNMSELIAAGSGELRAALAGVSDAKVIDEAELAKAKEYRAAIDSFKDSIDDLVIAVGQGAAPMLGQLATTVGSLIGWFGKLDAVTGGAAGTFATTGVAVLGLAGTISFVGGEVIELAGHFKKLGPTGQAAGVVAGLGLFAMSMRAKQAAESTAKINEEISKLGRATDSGAIRGFFEGLAEAALPNRMGIDKYFDSVAQGSIEAAKRVRELLVAQGAQPAVIERLTAAIDKEVAAVAQGEKTTKRFGDATIDFGEATKEAEKPVVDLTDVVQDQIDALEEQADALRDTIDALEEQQSAFQAAADAQYAVSESGSEYGAFIKELPAKLKEAGKNEAERNEVLREGTKLAHDHAKAQVDLATEVATSDGVTLSATQKLDIYNQGMLNAAGASKELSGELVNYITNARDIPETVKTEILAAIKDGDIPKAKQLLDDASAERKVAMEVDVNQASLNQADRELDALANQQRIAKIQADVSALIYGSGAGTVRRDGGADGDPNTALYSGGPVPGSEHQAVPIIAHGGEYVLSADVVKAIKRGQASRGLTPQVNITRTQPSGPTGGVSGDPDQAAEDAVEREERVQRAMYETGDSSLDAYRDYLRGRLSSYEKYSDDWVAAWRQIDSLNREEASANRAYLEGQQRSAEEAVRMSQDRIRSAYDQAEAQRALRQAEIEVAEAIQDVAEADAEAAEQRRLRDRGEADDSDVARADQGSAAARRRLAQEAFQGAGARAAANGLQTGSVEWARFVRAEVEAYAAANPDLAGLLMDWLRGVPQLASGGIVKARPGGTLVNVGEGGRDEAVVPLENGRAVGGGVTYVTMHMPVVTDRTIARLQAKYQRRNGGGMDGVVVNAA